jgi:photosystem II stability/assembly factor-like uncharacterized protein
VLVAALVAALVLIAVGVSIGVTSGPPAARPRHPAATATSGTSAPTGASLFHIAFSSPTTGYGLFELQPQSGGTCEDLVGHTTDGGAQFGTLMTVDTYTCGSSSPVDSLSFDDHGDGFVYGPTLYVTHDEGLTWTHSTQPGAVLSVQAIGRSVWMAEADCSFGAPAVPTSCNLELLESSDGGRTWKSAPTQPPGATVPSNGAAVSQESALGQTWLVRTGRSSGYLVSNPVPNITGSAATAPLWYTADGGAAWTVRQIPCRIAALSVVMAVAPEGTLFAMCAGQPSAGFQQKSADRSTDRGAQWTSHVACITAPSAIATAPGCVREPLDGGYLAGIAAISKKTAFVVGGRAPLRVTHDGGTRWSTVEPPIGGTTAGTTQVVFFNLSDGIVVGRNANDHGVSTLWSTRDGGGHWTAHVPRTGVVEAVQADVVLGADGLGVVKVGASQAKAVATVRRYLGPPTVTTTRGVCPGRTEVEWNDLALEFYRGNLAGYRYMRGGLTHAGSLTKTSSPLTPPLRTATGATLGMTLAQVRPLYPAGDFSEEQGGSINVPGTKSGDHLRLEFFSDTASTPLEEIKGGITCGDI